MDSCGAFLCEILAPFMCYNPLSSLIGKRFYTAVCITIAFSSFAFRDFQYIGVLSAAFSAKCVRSFRIFGNK